MLGTHRVKKSRGRRTILLPMHAGRAGRHFASRIFVFFMYIHIGSTVSVLQAGTQTFIVPRSPHPSTCMQAMRRVAISCPREEAHTCTSKIYSPVNAVHLTKDVLLRGIIQRSPSPPPRYRGAGEAPLVLYTTKVERRTRPAQKEEHKQISARSQEAEM